MIAAICRLHENNMALTLRKLRQFRFKHFYCRRCYTLPPAVDLDWDYLKNPENHGDIIENCKRRGIKADMTLLLSQLRQETTNVNESLQKKLRWLPNKTHPRVFRNSTSHPTFIEEVGIQRQFSYFPATFDSLAKRLNALRTQYLGHITGKRSYFLKNDLARLERSLLNYTNNKLQQKGFILMSVPDIVHEWVFGGCGFNTEGEHSQVFQLEEQFGEKLYLSGTAEMGIAAYCANKEFNYTDLPLRFCAISRCYRAEAKRGVADKGIYRVHYFTKFEMFGLTAAETGEESEQLLQEFTEVQKELFTDLGLHFKVLEMPPGDLGLPAYRKIDMETWMPGKKMYGEISSASNCTDYQARRMNIRYNVGKDSHRFCHTVNGTACAVPRMLIAIFENFQNLDGSINVPLPLQKFMGKDMIKDAFDEKQNYLKRVG